jgi:hypothetical protein
MNKLINDLCEHTDFYVGNEHYDKSYEEKQRLFMEKYTQLIIQEAIIVLDRDDGATHHRELLMKHFWLSEAI